MNIILASGSPRRINMMKEKGYDPIIMPADVNEDIPFEISMESAVMYLAAKKALWVENKLKESGEIPENSLIIAADTVVYKNRIIGKPESAAEAFDTLSSLQNDSHYVATGVCLMRPGMPVREAFCEVTEVFFTNIPEDELRAYVATDEPYDKAGGYAIQGTFAKYIDHFDGDYNNVVGFPWARIEQELNKFL
jgi:septum formation protein